MNSDKSIGTNGLVPSQLTSMQYNLAGTEPQLKGFSKTTIVREWVDSSTNRWGDSSKCNPHSSALTNMFDRLHEVVETLVSFLKTFIDSLGSLSQTSAPETLPETTTPPENSIAPSEPTVDATEPTAVDPNCGCKESSAKQAKKLGKTGEFLWKPVSDKDGKLAVLLPSQYTGRVKNVKIIDPSTGKVLEKGKSSGTGNPVNGKGEREHFRFDKAGGKYPDGAVVQITLNNGNTIEVKIKNTSERLQR